jgi:hypothetical protein
MSVSAAQSRVLQAQTLMESRRYDQVDPVLDVGMGFVAGLPEEEAAALTAEMAGLRVAAAEAVATGQPGPDHESPVTSIRARLRAADREIAVAAAALAEARLEAHVAESWSLVQNTIEGWQQESVPPDAPPDTAPDLPQTSLAISRTGFLLADPETRQIRAESAGNPAIEAVYRGAEDVLDAAAAKMYAAYTQVLDKADELPVPTTEADQSRLSQVEAAAKAVLAGTTYQRPVLARIRRLGERWKTEYALGLKARHGHYDRLVVEADAAWPAIVAATGATADVDPTDAAATGRTVLLAGVRNQAGRDFTGQDFCLRHNGILIGGGYQPYVQQALEQARRELKLDVEDQIGWDVVGVVAGRGRIGERTTRIVKDGNNREIDQIEEWSPVDCVQLRIIALHAGPVAVGPEQ